MGFKKNHSTTLQLARIINVILIEFNKDKTTAMTLIDLEKAFDTVWINGLVKKMCVNGINFAKLIRVLSDLENLEKSGNLKMRSKSQGIR
jgi:hypothetical protein